MKSVESSADLDQFVDFNLFLLKKRVLMIDMLYRPLSSYESFISIIVSKLFHGKYCDY